MLTHQSVSFYRNIYLQIPLDIDRYDLGDKLAAQNCVNVASKLHELCIFTFDLMHGLLSLNTPTFSTENSCLGVGICSLWKFEITDVQEHPSAD